MGFGGFLFWGFTTNLDSAAVATGNVIVDSQRKTVSHLEGGILKRLRVVDGETVAKGQALIELDDTRARSELEQLSARRIGLLAKRARLRAEQSLRQEISFPTELSELTSEIANDVITGEKRHFEQRRSLHDGRIAIQEKEIEQLTARLEALTAQIDANAVRKTLVEERAVAMRALAEKGFVSKATLSEVELELSELIGDGGELVAERALSEQKRQGAEVEVLAIEQEWQSEIAGELVKAQLDLKETEERLVAARDVLDRLVVLAPQDGVVINIQKRTPGGVVEPGLPIMDIVPRDERMIVEAKMNLRDIRCCPGRVGNPGPADRLRCAQHRTIGWQGDLPGGGSDRR